MMFSRKSLGLSVAAVALCSAPVAIAQEQTAPATGQEERVNVLDTVIVTATKRSESQQEVGLSVAAFSGQSIRDLGVDDAKGVINLVPGTGITEPNGGGIPVIIIRGIGLQNFRINDTPTTAIYVDEVYQTSVAEAVATIFDVERVEVLKGPQGGLYGRNAVGGAIQIVSAKPNFDEFEGYASANYKQYGRKEGELVFSGPISDTLAYRIGGKIVQGGGYFYNTVSNEHHGDADRLAVRGMIGYRPNANTDILFKLHGGQDKSDLLPGRVIGAYQPLGLGLGGILGIPDTSDAAILNAFSATADISNICAPVLNGGRAPDFCETLNGKTPSELGLVSRYDNANGSKPWMDNEWWGASLKADFDFGAYTFTSISAYNSFAYRRYIDQDGLPEVHQEIDYSSDIEAWSQEFRLGYDNGARLSWLAGISYAEDEITEDTLLFTETGLLRATLGGLTRSSQIYVQGTEAFAAFGRVDWSFADRLKLVLETRYTNEEKSLSGGTYLPQISAVLAETDDSTTYDALSGKIALEYAPTSDILLYASYSEGFKSGGYFGGFATNPGQLDPFDQEEISAVELGFKSDWPQQALRVNGAAFYYDRRGVQASGIDETGIVPIARLMNIGDVEVYGLELETVWAPVRQLTFQGGFSWLQNEIVSSNVQPGNLFNSPEPATFVGARLPNQPEVSANLVARYEENISTGLLAGVQLTYTYRGEQDLGLVVFPEERRLMTEKAYQLVNLKASIGPDDGRWKLSAYFENLFDEAYRTTAGGGAPGGFQEIYGAPRIFGVGLEYRF